MEVETVDGIEAISADIGDEDTVETVLTPAEAPTDDDGFNWLWLLLLIPLAVLGWVLFKPRKDKDDYIDAC
jgi:hypothetical protein